MPAKTLTTIVAAIASATGVSLRRFIRGDRDRALSAADIFHHPTGHVFRGYANPQAFVHQVSESSDPKPLPRTAANPDIRHWVLWGNSARGREMGGVDGLESHTSSPITAGVYAGLRDLPSVSIITENATAPVYVRPGEMCKLDPTFFDALDRKILAEPVDPSNLSRDELEHQPCTQTVLDNHDEITHIYACYFHGKAYHFQRDPKRSVFAVHEVSTAGRLATSSLLRFFGIPDGLIEPMHIQSHRNPDFRETPLSLEIALAPEPYVRMMEKAARERGVIGPGERLLRLEDACAVFPPGTINQFDYEGVMKTLMVKSVPASIAIGDRAGLMKHLEAELKLFREDPAIHGMDHRHNMGSRVDAFKRLMGEMDAGSDPTSPTSPAPKPGE